MKRLLLATSFLLLTSASFAATSGNLTLRGTVALVHSLTLTAESGAVLLDLSQNAVDLKVATINEKSNSSSGYKISVSSTNAGKLVRAGGTESVTYTMKYGGSAVSLATATDVVISSTAGLANANKDVTISFTGAAADTMVQGAYEDTVSFTIAAN